MANAIVICSRAAAGSSSSASEAREAAVISQLRGGDPRLGQPVDHQQLA
jgi:hypothetical protein